MLHQSDDPGSNLAQNDFFPELERIKVMHCLFLIINFILFAISQEI